MEEEEDLEIPELCTNQVKKIHENSVNTPIPPYCYFVSKMVHVRLECVALSSSQLFSSFTPQSSWHDVIDEFHAAPPSSTGYSTSY